MSETLWSRRGWMMAVGTFTLALILGGVAQAQNIARLGPLREQGCHGMLHAAVGKIAEERVARAQGEKGQRGGLGRDVARKQAVDDFVGSSVSTDGDEFSVTARIGVARDLGGLAGRGSFHHADRHAAHT